MKAFRIFFRSIRDSFKSVMRNFSLSMASVLCTTITLIIVAVAIIITVNVNTATKEVEDELNIVVYVKRGVEGEDLENLKTDIKSIDTVIKVDFISKEEQKIQMSEYSDTFETILNYLDENPLLDSFVVYTEEVTDITKTAKKILELPNVETAKYGEGMVEEVVSAFDFIEKVTIGIVIALALVTIFLISNTIKLTIYSRKTEIEIMRLVGASNTAIKLPFVFEGLILGVIGAIIPICVTIYGYIILYNSLGGHLFTEMLELVKPEKLVIYVSLILVVFGSLVGAYGSVKAVRKYLKI